MSHLSLVPISGYRLRLPSSLVCSSQAWSSATSRSCSTRLPEGSLMQNLPLPTLCFKHCVFSTASCPPDHAQGSPGPSPLLTSPGPPPMTLLSLPIHAQNSPELWCNCDHSLYSVIFWTFPDTVLSADCPSWVSPPGKLLPEWVRGSLGQVFPALQDHQRGQLTIP